MQTGRPVFVAATLAAALVAGVVCVGPGHDATARGLAPATLTLPPAPAQAQPGRAAPPASAPADLRLSVRIDRLARSGDPVDAFAAYRLVTRCLWARAGQQWLASQIAPEDRGQLPTPRTACGDIASDQVQSRLRWLEFAAAAGVHHAATALAREGPDGLGLVDPGELDGPEHADWAARLDAAYDAGVRTCDTDSLEERVDAYENGRGVAPDAARALSYWIAFLDCRGRAAGAPTQQVEVTDSVTRRLAGAAGPDHAATAIETGHDLARAARPLPGDS